MPSGKNIFPGGRQDFCSHFSTKNMAGVVVVWFFASGFFVCLWVWGWVWGFFWAGWGGVGLFDWLIVRKILYTIFEIWTLLIVRKKLAAITLPGFWLSSLSMCPDLYFFMHLIQLFLQSTCLHLLLILEVCWIG